MSRTPDLLAKISLLRAAEEVFSEKGIALAKVEEITRRAGLSKGAFYLHFDSKEDAFKEVVESFLARCTAIFQGPHALPDESIPHDPDEALEFILDRDEQAFEFLWQNRAFLAIVESCSGPQGYLLDAFLEGMRKNSMDWAHAWEQRGLFRKDLDRDVVSTLMVGGYRALVRRMTASETRPPIRQWVSEALTLFVRGLGTDPLLNASRRPHHPRAPRKPRN
jgi:AcrR family transcriptional regulator